MAGGLGASVTLSSITCLSRRSRGDLSCPQVPAPALSAPPVPVSAPAALGLSGRAGRRSPIWGPSPCPPPAPACLRAAGGGQPFPPWGHTEATSCVRGACRDMPSGKRKPTQAIQTLGDPAGVPQGASDLEPDRQGHRSSDSGGHSAEGDNSTFLMGTVPRGQAGAQAGGLRGPAALAPCGEESCPAGPRRGRGL